VLEDLEVELEVIRVVLFQRSPVKCLPFVILTGIEAVIFFIDGLISLNLFWVIFASIKIYIFIVIYSLYQLLRYGDEQERYEAHQNANSAGYEQYYEPESYSNIDRDDMGQNGYQTTNFGNEYAEP
jgi:hypothetical protein